MSGNSQGFTLAEAAEVASIVGAVGIVGVIGIIWNAAASGLRATFFSRRDLASRLNRLACGVTTGYVMSLFGPPVFKRDITARLGEDAPETVEHIYRTRHAWLQVVVRGRDDAVQCFSVTVTDGKFTFSTRHLSLGCLHIRLGATRFKDVSASVDGWRTVIAARRAGYAESHWFGNSGGYQAYVLAFNDAGIGHYEPPPPFSPGPHNSGRFSFEESYQGEPVPEWLKPARDGTTINTFSVLGAGASRRLATVSGVDGDYIRVLRDPRNDRQARREWERHKKHAGRPQLAPQDEPGEVAAD
jgi:hypothetical protein